MRMDAYEPKKKPKLLYEHICLEKNWRSHFEKCNPFLRFLTAQGSRKLQTAAAAPQTVLQSSNKVIVPRGITFPRHFVASIENKRG